MLSNRLICSGMVPAWVLSGMRASSVWQFWHVFSRLSCSSMYDWWRTFPLAKHRLTCLVVILLFETVCSWCEMRPNCAKKTDNVLWARVFSKPGPVDPSAWPQVFVACCGIRKLIIKLPWHGALQRLCVASRNLKGWQFPNTSKTTITQQPL